VRAKSSNSHDGRVECIRCVMVSVTEHTKVHDSVVRHEPTTGLHPSRIVTRYDADSPEASIDWPIDEKNPRVPERDSTDVSAERHIRCP